MDAPGGSHESTVLRDFSHPLESREALPLPRPAPPARRRRAPVRRRQPAGDPVRADTTLARRETPCISTRLKQYLQIPSIHARSRQLLGFGHSGSARPPTRQSRSIDAFLEQTAGYAPNLSECDGKLQRYEPLGGPSWHGRFASIEAASRRSAVPMALPF